MRVKVLDRETLAQISSSDVTSWLVVTGWKHERTVSTKFARFTKKVGVEEAEVEVPIRAELRDFALRMAEVLDMLAAVEQRSSLAILHDIRQVQVDTLRLRFAGAPTREGRVTAENGAELFKQTRDLLLAGACSAVEKRAVFAKRKPDQAMRFLQHAMFAPPESGSFVIVVESPVAPLLQPSPLEDDVDPPFERRAMRALAVGMHAVQRAAEQASVRHEIEPFVAAIEDGVSANLCEAIVGLLRSLEGCALDTRFTWSRNRPRPESVPEQMVFAPDRAPILEAVAKDFRAREPLLDFELRGPILELASDDPALGGVLTIGGAVENRVVKVRAQVDPTAYGRAIQAHRDKLAISLEGELTREGRSHVLRNPRGFAVESEE